MYYKYAAISYNNSTVTRKCGVLGAIKRSCQYANAGTFEGTPYDELSAVYQKRCTEIHDWKFGKLHL